MDFKSVGPWNTTGNIETSVMTKMYTSLCVIVANTTRVSGIKLVFHFFFFYTTQERKAKAGEKERERKKTPERSGCCFLFAVANQNVQKCGYQSGGMQPMKVSGKSGCRYGATVIIHYNKSIE